MLTLTTWPGLESPKTQAFGPAYEECLLDELKWKMHLTVVESWTGQKGERAPSSSTRSLLLAVIPCDYHHYFSIMVYHGIDCTLKLCAKINSSLTYFCLVLTASFIKTLEGWISEMGHPQEPNVQGAPGPLHWLELGLCKWPSHHRTTALTEAEKGALLWKLWGLSLATLMLPSPGLCLHVK